MCGRKPANAKLIHQFMETGSTLKQKSPERPRISERVLNTKCYHVCGVHRNMYLTTVLNSEYPKLRYKIHCISSSALMFTTFSRDTLRLILSSVANMDTEC